MTEDKIERFFAAVHRRGPWPTQPGDADYDWPATRASEMATLRVSQDGNTLTIHRPAAVRVTERLDSGGLWALYRNDDDREPILHGTTQHSLHEGDEFQLPATCVYVPKAVVDGQTATE